MKNILLFSRALAYSLLLLLIDYTAAHAQSTKSVTYICPMYCTDETASEPGKRCSVCNMELEDKNVVENPTTHKLMFPQQALDLSKKEQRVLFLDVRNKNEYDGDEGHISHAVLIPIRDLEKRVKELEPYRDYSIIAYCSHGIRSAQAAQLLSKQGFTAFSLVGGMTKWNREKLPTVVE
ncbi:MAG TPA: rhodanese-like domain-containing protein [Bacteroidota bacterium]